MQTNSKILGCNQCQLEACTEIDYSLRGANQSVLLIKFGEFGGLCAMGFGFITVCTGVTVWLCFNLPWGIWQILSSKALPYINFISHDWWLENLVWKVIKFNNKQQTRGKKKKKVWWQKRDTLFANQSAGYFASFWIFQWVLLTNLNP